MGQVICSSCFEVEDTTKRFIELPYVCDLCEKDSALAIEQDVWEAEYVGPACQQAAEEVHDLYGWKNHVAFQPSPLSVPCQSALDSVQAEAYDILDAHNADVLDQFDEDTDIINDVREQLDEAHAANVRLTEEIEFCDRRVRAYQQVAVETDKHAAGLEETIEILKSELRGISIRANDAVLDTSF